MERQHKGNNPLILSLKIDGVDARLPACERWQVIFDTPNPADTATVRLRWNGLTNQPIASLGGANPFITSEIVYCGPDAFVNITGPAGTRALILTSGDQEQSERNDGGY